MTNPRGPKGHRSPDGIVHAPDPLDGRTTGKKVALPNDTEPETKTRGTASADIANAPRRLLHKLDIHLRICHRDRRNDPNIMMRTRTPLVPDITDAVDHLLVLPRKSPQTTRYQHLPQTRQIPASLKQLKTMRYPTNLTAVREYIPRNQVRLGPVRLLGRNLLRQRSPRRKTLNVCGLADARDLIKPHQS